MNYSDTERLKTLLEGYGFDETEKQDEADLVVFNSCSVKQKAENKVYGDIRNTSDDQLIALTGCMVKSGKEDKMVKKIKKLSIAFRPENMGELGGALTRLRPEWDMEKVNGSLEKYFEIHPKVSNKYQVFVPIMTGCDKFCTYCIVPYARGREKSRPMDEVLVECTKLVKAGAKEITLLGQTVDSYGISNADKQSGEFEGVNFTTLLCEIDKLHEKGLDRLRFTSPHPTDFSQELINAIAKLKTTCPHIHLPVQSGSNSCLRRMNRPYTREQYIDIVDRIREAIPNCAISTDIIVGFCGETEKEFRATYDFFEEICFDMAYISRYSTRKGTFADKKLKDDVPYETKAKRWHRLNDLLRETSTKNNKKYIGRKLEVLIETQDDKKLIGRSREYKEVHIMDFDTGSDWVGEIIQVKITKAREWLLAGEAAT